MRILNTFQSGRPLGGSPRSYHVFKQAPPSSSPPYTGAQELVVNDRDCDYEYEADVAPWDINLHVDERNIISGKRKRTVSSRAAQGEGARQAKRGTLTR
jgi:hypothetical protein